MPKLGIQGRPAPCANSENGGGEGSQGNLRWNAVDRRRRARHSPNPPTTFLSVGASQDGVFGRALSGRRLQVSEVSSSRNTRKSKGWLSGSRGQPGSQGVSQT